MTWVTNKHFLPVYDKPMIFYPLSTLMLAGIRNIVVISSSRDLDAYRNLLGDGSDFGLRLNFIEQTEPRGIAEAFLLADEVSGRTSCCLILGDNIFHGSRLGASLAHIAGCSDGRATVFAYEVGDPRAFAVVSLDAEGAPLKIEEKPEVPASNLAVPGLYFFPSDVFERATQLPESHRGELEVTDLNKLYLAEGRLDVLRLPRGSVWIDAGTPAALIEAGQFVRTITELHGLMVSCPEEIAFKSGWIGEDRLKARADALADSQYGQYLRSVLRMQSSGGT